MCFGPSFDNVTRINFRFRLLVTRSSPRRRGASIHIIWCKISLFSPKLLTLFRNSRWRPPPSWIFSLCKFGHSGVLVVWYLCSVPNLVQISVIVSEIDAHNASDVHLMTSRELNSGFNFWSRGHLCSAWPWCVLPWNLVQISLSNPELLIFFLKLKMAAAAILEMLGWAMGPPTKPQSWRVPPVKMLSWSAK